MTNVKEVIVGKDEAGMFEYEDTKISIEMGEKAFLIRVEDAFAGTMNKMFFKNRENAEKY